MEEGLDFVAVFPEGAATCVLPAQGAGVADPAEQRGLEGLEHTAGCHVAVRDGGEGAGLSRAVRPYVEESTAGGEASAQRFLIAGEGQEDEIVGTCAAFLKEGFHFKDLLIGKG